MTSRYMGQGFCDDSTKAVVMKRVTMRKGVIKNCPKFCDVVYGRPLFVKVLVVPSLIFAPIISEDWQESNWRIFGPCFKVHSFRIDAKLKACWHIRSVIVFYTCFHKPKYYETVLSAMEKNGNSIPNLAVMHWVWHRFLSSYLREFC